MKLRMPGGRFAFAFAATPESGVARVTVDARSQTIDLTNPSGVDYYNRFMSFTVPPRRRTTCRVLLPYGPKPMLRLTSVPGDDPLEVWLFGAGWEGPGAPSVSPAALESAKALGLASISKRGDVLVVTTPDDKGSLELPALRTALTPHIGLRVLTFVILFVLVLAALLLLLLIARRVQRMTPWEPNLVPMIERRIVLAVALGVHICVFLASPGLIGPDGPEYVAAARLVLHPWTPTTFNPAIGPGYPIIIEIVNRIAGDSQGLIFFQHILMALACYFAWFLVRERIGRFGAAIFAVAAIFCPYMLTFPSYVMTEAVYVALYVIVLFVSTRQFRYSWIHAAVLGATVAATTLVRVQALMLLPFALLLACVLAWRSRLVLHTLVALAAFAAVLAPVAAFNAKRGNSVASTRGGLVLFWANLHGVTDWSIPELAFSPELEVAWARATFHPVRRPPSNGPTPCRGGMFEHIVKPYFRWPGWDARDRLKGEIASASFNHDPVRYTRKVLRAVRQLTDAGVPCYRSTASGLVGFVVMQSSGSELNPKTDGIRFLCRPWSAVDVNGVRPRLTPSLIQTLIRAFMGFFDVRLFFWVVMGAVVGAAVAPLERKRDPLLLCLSVFGLVYLLPLAVMTIDLSRYAVASYLPCLAATVLALSTISRWAIARLRRAVR
jgi:hypothetical protein